MIAVKNYKFWFCTGSQDLYGDECLAHVAEHSRIIVDCLNESGILPYEVVWKPTLITNELIRRTFNEANADDACAGVITWMHTFSPAKSWILGLQEFRKPLMHFHTQFNQEIPYDTIDMDFMNENQSAHGDREYGHMVTRMGIERKVIVGHWSDEKVVGRIAAWMRTAVGIMESSHVRVARFADNMRNVAVTEGDKVEAQMKFGWEVDAYPVNELAEYVKAVPKGDITALVDEYYSKYTILPEGRDPEEFKRHVAVQAQIEAGLEKFLLEKDYHAIVTHFGDLGELQQLPGLAIQRLMEKGYGFGAEGDWKTAAMVRTTCALTQLEGSPAHNVIPKQAKATVNVRVDPGETVDTAFARIKERFDEGTAYELAEVSEPSPIAPFHDDPAYDYLRRVIHSVYPSAGIAPYVQTSCSDARRFHRICPRTYRFAGILFKGDQRNRVHGQDENLDVDSYVKGIGFYTEFIRNLDALGK